MSIRVALSTELGFTIIDHWLLVGPHLARPDAMRFGPHVVRPDAMRFGLQLPLVLSMLGLTE